MLPNAPFLPLSADLKAVHLWCIEHSNASIHQLLDESAGLLSTDERNRSKAFLRETDRLCYSVSRVFVKVVLSKYVDIAPETVTFKYNAYGKPGIANRIRDAETKISFNLSHTDDLIVLAVRNGGEVGVDVENPSLRRAPLELTNEVFSLKEMEELQNLPQSMKDLRFFQHWTLKEAYIKARGQGLSIPLNLFGFSFCENRIHLHLQSELNDFSSNWTFWQLELCNRYVVAVCSKRENFAQDLVVYGFAPPMQQKLIPYRITWKS